MIQILSTLTFLFFALSATASVNVTIDGELYSCSRSGAVAQGRYRCVPNCVSRYSNGACSNYSSTDFCGYDASCALKCLSRYSDGSCISYGPDICRSTGS